ncbi:MAG TPA: hypothetical protein P5218_15095, partial [Planctomycetota bacterium]|nr:hypothetical protein [Planctomycetota bacterium]
LGVAGGSLFQVLAPMAVIAVFVRQNDLFALTVGGVWWSTSLYGVATYLGDARSQSLPLVSLGGGDPIHDWNYLLTRMHLLEMDGFLSGVLRVLAFLLMWSSIAWGGYVLYAMLTRQGRPAPLSSRAS